MLSIIIPAYNEGGKLEPAIARLRELSKTDGVPVEIVVAVNGATDNTEADAKRLADVVTSTPLKGLSRARNMGALASHGEGIVFLDVDTRLRPGALQAFARLAKPGIAGTCSAVPDKSNWKAHMTVVLKNLVRGLGIVKGLSGPVVVHRSLIHEHKVLFREDLNIAEIHDFLYRARKQAGVRYRYIWRRLYTFSVNRYERVGYAKTFKFWAWYWWYGHLLKHDHRALEEEYWSQ
jgi:glycosyltransferase involved in cell wall biosynthesis